MVRAATRLDRARCGVDLAFAKLVEAAKSRLMEVQRPTPQEATRLESEADI